MRSPVRHTVFAFALVVAAFGWAMPTPAQIQVGAEAPNFSKQELVGSSLGATRSLYEFKGKIVLLYLLGYG